MTTQTFRTHKPHESRTHTYPGGGVQHKFRFANGYGASVVMGPHTYGGPHGLWELAVLTGDGRLTYDTPVTGDVLGYLTEDAVADALDQIQALPALEAVS